MFKKATIIGYYNKDFLPAVIGEEFKFTPPLSNEMLRQGWSPVRDDVYSYAQGAQFLLHFSIEKKILPAGAVKLVVAEKAKEIEEQQGFPLGKKAMKDLKERVIDELLPRALSSRITVPVWIDRVRQRIVIESTAGNVVEAVQRALYKTFGDVLLQDVAWPRAKVLTEWLGQGEPEHFTLDDAVHLQYPNAQRKVVKFAKTNLAGEDVHNHVEAGAVVQALAMTYNSRISFTITDGGQLRGIKALGVLKEGSEGVAAADRFDNDFVLMTGELQKLIDELGEVA